MINSADLPEIKSVMDFFSEISKIPRGSGNTRGIAEYLYNFGTERGLESYRDAFDNVIIKKPSSAGFSDRPTVVIQGHSDIVAQKEPGCPLDMARDGLDIYRDGDFIKAHGTTLGADDGIAVAYALALLDSKDIPHPALECVFTSDEEIGLIGAKNIAPSLIDGRIMINIDSDEEGVFTVGCAGGARCDISLDLSSESFSGDAYRLSLTGLLGGHSGVDIDKCRTNAVKLLCELLSAFSDIRLSELVGGDADNAIPRNAYAVFQTSEDICAEKLQAVASRLSVGEHPLITLEKAETNKAFSRLDSRKILDLVGKIPSGVYKMSPDIDGLVETSSNLGICKLSSAGMELTVSVRSSDLKEKTELISAIQGTVSDFGGRLSVRGDYPGWAYKKESLIRDRFAESYKRLFDSEPKIVMIHAGLECGLFSDKLQGLDCISLGPDNFDIHTPNERLSIYSCNRVWRLLLDVLKNI